MFTRAGATADQPLDGLRIGVPKEFFGDGLAPDVRAAIDRAGEYEEAGRDAGRHQPAAHRAVDPRVLHHRAGRGVVEPERASTASSSGTARRSTATCSTCTSKTRAEGFGDEVKRRIMIGTYVLSHGYYDAYYLQAQKLRRMIADDFQACFKAVRRDRRAGGAERGLEARRAERHDPVADYLADIFTLPASWPGCPA
jgi:aspartyl-tRNA(Asn)/glutamyl-tRNA(Gln) amidotransferase subunit A